jgi:hypothetical protein
MSISTEGELTDDQIEKVKLGDRIKLGAVTGTIVMPRWSH